MQELKGRSQVSLWIMQELNPARFEKVEVKEYTTSGISSFELACTPQSISRHIRILDEYILILDDVSYDNSPMVATSFLDGAAWT